MAKIEMKTDRLPIGEIVNIVLKNLTKKKYYNIDKNTFHLSTTTNRYKYVDNEYKILSDDLQLYNDVLSLIIPRVTSSEDQIKNKSKEKSKKKSKEKKGKTEGKTEGSAELSDFILIHDDDVSSLNEMFSKTKIDDKDKHVKKEKKRRISIPKKIREETWYTHNGYDSMNGVCFCCEGEIRFTSWECGHIISDANGGPTNVSNLVPLCFECNRSMGKKDMREYMKQYYPKSLKKLDAFKLK